MPKWRRYRAIAADRVETVIDRSLNALSAALCGAFGLSRPSSWSARIAHQLGGIAHEAGDEHKCRFVASSPLALMRARTLLSKEPETIRWIRSFAAEDVFYDIGANVGTYSIFAAHKCNAVYAFEPEAQNFALLNKNIALNNLDDKITAFPLAVSDAQKLDTLRLSAVMPGAALHSFATNVDFKGMEFVPAFRQGSLSMTLDDLVFAYNLRFPTQIKIDVDGLEAQIVKGAARVLKDSRLKGVLIEINESDSDDVALIPLLEDHGLRIAARGDLVSAAGQTFKMRNYVFSRNT